MNKQAYTMNKQDFNFPRQRNKFLFWLQQSLWMCPSWEWICIILKIFTYFWPPGWKAIYPLYDKCHQRDRITAINNKGWTDYFLQSFFLTHYGIFNESKIKGKLQFFNLTIYWWATLCQDFQFQIDISFDCVFQVLLNRRVWLSLSAIDT